MVEIILVKLKDFINKLYSYETEEVLFSLTLLSDTQFRLDKISTFLFHR